MIQVKAILFKSHFGYETLITEPRLVLMEAVDILLAFFPHTVFVSGTPDRILLFSYAKRALISNAHH